MKTLTALLLFAAPVLCQKPAAGKPTFEMVCGACHPSAMAEDLRSEADWRETVDLMMKTGAKATPEQLADVIRFLLENWTKVNVNTATAAEIAPVLSVSQATAGEIVKRRNFRTLDDLKKVPGVDPAILDERKDRIHF